MEKTLNPAEETFETFGHGDTHDLVDIPELHNLTRLGVLRWVRAMPTTLGSISDAGATLQGVQLTELGWEFINACNHENDGTG